MLFPSLDVSKLEVVYNQQTASPRGKIFFRVIKYLLIIPTIHIPTY